MIKDVGGFLVSIIRSKNNDYVDIHQSEMESMNITTDFQIHNDGTSAELKKDTKEILKQIKKNFSKRPLNKVK